MSYLPFLDILRSYFDIKEGGQESIINQKMTEKVTELDEKLESALPAFREVLSLRLEEEDFLKLVPQQKKERTFEAIRNLLIRMSHEKPLILVIEDLHWIDKTSEELLDYLIGWFPGSHILLVLLYRPEYTHPWGSKTYYRKIGLTQLTTQSSTELVQAILEEGDKARGSAPGTTIGPSVILQVVLQVIAFLNNLVIAKVVVLNSFVSITEQGRH